MNFIELLINDPSTTSLDLNQEMDIALQYSIADIKDISKRNAAYSKTIIIPGTKNNNYWFGNLFDVNTDFTLFNPNKKIAARLLVNTETVIDGFLQLRKIVKLNNTDQQGNMINYEVVLFNNAVNLMTELGEKTINELDMSEFGHTFSAANIKASWNNTYKDGYVYPMYGTHTKSNQYKPEYFYPAIFYRTMLDQMVREAGFGWTGSLVTNDQFNHEVIAYVTDGRPKIDETERRRRLFKVGMNIQEVNLGYYPNTFAGNFPLQIGSGYGTPSSGWTFSFTNETSPFFDNDNNWNSSLYTWNVDRNGKYSAQYNLSYNFNLKNKSGSTTMALDTVINKYPQVKLDHYLQYKKSGSSTWVNWDTSTQIVNYNVDTIAPGASASNSVYVARQAPTIDLSIGDTVRLVWKGYQNNQGWWVGTGGAATPAMDAIMSFNTSNGGSWISNNAETSDFTQNDYIDLAKYLPDKVKQKDLLNDLIKRYNLYIQTDPNNPKMLIFDTRPDFYNRGTILDWTNKKDFSIIDEVELLSDLQFKLMIWSYKADNTDIYNKEYTDVTGDIYGQYKYYFDNDFVKGETRIESQFSPSPLVKTPFNAIVPGIDPENPKVQPRIFYWGGLKSCPDKWQWTYQTPTGLTSSVETFTEYPYAGHFDDPLDPQIDINFGTSKYYFYNDWASIPDGNMFNTYWSDYVRQIENGKLVTSSFYLDEYDIRYIKDNFYSKIFIVDSYYYVNKIIDYKPLNNGLTKVELIKIVDGVTWKAPRRPFTARDIARREEREYVRFSELTVGSGNKGDGGGIIFGDRNISSGKTYVNDEVYLKRSLVVGDDNNNQSDGSLIVGSRNSISEDFGVILNGYDNNVEAENVTLIGTRGLSITESNVVYLGNSFSVNTITGEVYAPGFTSSGGSTITAGNGLSEIAPGIVGLGGTLSQNTLITGAEYNLNIENVGDLTITASYVSSITNNGVYLGSMDDLVSPTSEGYVNISNGLITARAYNSTGEGILSLDDTSASLSSKVGSTQSSINMSHYVIFNSTDGSVNSMIVKDDTASKGLVYFDDYSSNFTTHSLVTKGYVDSLTPTTPPLSDVLIAGNTTGTTNIYIPKDFGIRSSSGVSDSLGLILDLDGIYLFGGTASFDDAAPRVVVGALASGDFSVSVENNVLFDLNKNELGGLGTYSIQNGDAFVINNTNVVDMTLNTSFDVEVNGSDVTHIFTDGSTAYLKNTGGEDRNTTAGVTYDNAELRQVQGTSDTKLQVSNNDGFYQSQFASTDYTKGVSKTKFVSAETTDNATYSVVYPFSDLEIGTGIVSVKVNITAMNSTEDLGYVSELFAGVRINSYVPTIMGGVDKLEKTEYTTASSYLDIDDTGNLAVMVKGETSETITWTIKYELIYGV